VSVQSWREWFVPPPDDPNEGTELPPEHVTEEEVRMVSGTGHQGNTKPLKLLQKTPPRCAHCKKFVGYSTGMHLMLSGEWRIHISCFAAVLEAHYELGEVIDLTNGSIRQREDFTD
jgi:hypothetical protein